MITFSLVRLWPGATVGPCGVKIHRTQRWDFLAARVRGPHVRPALGTQGGDHYIHAAPKFPCSPSETREGGCLGLPRCDLPAVRYQVRHSDTDRFSALRACV